MAKISVANAAKMAKVQRSTLYRKNEKGELSFEEDETGAKVIDVSELMRVYPNAKVEATDETDAQQLQEQQLQQSATVNENKLLQQELKFLREKLADRESQLLKAEIREQDLSKKLDQIISNAADEKTLLLEDHRSREKVLSDTINERDKALQVAQEESRKDKKLFSWLRK